MVEISKREEIIEVVNKLFIYTDSMLWSKLQKDVLAESISFDMASLGAGPALRKTALEICNMWEAGFQGLDSVHHQAGNFLITINDGRATVFCYAIATHYKKSATKGNVREFVGSYDITLVLTDVGWRIDGFRYNLKYLNGNVDLV